MPSDGFLVGRSPASRGANRWQQEPQECVTRKLRRKKRDAVFAAERESSVDRLATGDERILGTGRGKPDCGVHRVRRLFFTLSRLGRAGRSLRASIVRGSPRSIAVLLAPAARQIFARSRDPLSVSTSYVIMRNGIGALGMALPIVLIIGGGLDHVQASLSAYYHFSSADPARYGAGTMRDAFVGMLFAIGAFLFFYRGHSFQEDMALNVAGICAVLVALVPMDWPPNPQSTASLAANIHSTAASIFFVMIAYVCIFHARDTLLVMRDRARRKVFRRVYLILGILMLATPTAVAALGLIAPAPHGHSTLLVEVAGVVVFATFWLVKSFEIRSSMHFVFTSHPAVGPGCPAPRAQGATMPEHAEPEVDRFAGAARDQHHF